MPKLKVAVVMGSDSDLPKLQPALNTLKEFGVPFTVNIISAHRTPEAAHAFSRDAINNGYGVIIAAAGGAAHLAGVMASMTTLPVIGIPVQSELAGGLDSLLSVAQMPSGVPVATVGANAGGPVNAAILAVQILAIADAEYAKKLSDYKVKIANNVMTKNEKVKNEFGG